MEDWFANNWWWVLPSVGMVSLVALKVRRRGGEETLPRRIFYSMFPVFDAKSETRRKLTPRVVIWWCIGLGIAVAYAIYDIGFAP